MVLMMMSDWQDNKEGKLKGNGDKLTRTLAYVTLKH